MEYFAGLDVSMDETHICVVDRDGGVVLETKVNDVARRQSRQAWQRHRRVSGSCSRPAAWRRCSTMAWLS